MKRMIEFENLIGKLLTKEYWPGAREIERKTREIYWTTSYIFPVTFLSALLIHVLLHLCYFYAPGLIKPIIFEIQNRSLQLFGTSEYLGYLYTILVFLVPYLLAASHYYRKLKFRKEYLNILLRDEKSEAKKAYDVIKDNFLLMEVCGLDVIEKKYLP